MRVVHQIEQGLPVTHALLGVSVAQTNTTPGARVANVQPGSGAAHAGLQPGDVITRLDHQVVDSPDALVAAVRAEAPGAQVTVTYLRAGSTHTTQVTLGSDGTTT